MRILYLPNCYSQQRQREKQVNIYPVRMAMEATYYAQRDNFVVWNKSNWKSFEWDKIITEPENLPFLSLPHPDRVFTRAKEYTSGNYKYLPGTHIMSASGCGWGKCTFCVEKDKPYEVRPVDDVISEIEECHKMGFREIFDDSATFPTGRWLNEFCKSLLGLNINRNNGKGRIRFGCNLRINSNNNRNNFRTDFKDMFSVGFRMVLFGMESANQETLDKINKRTKVEDFKYIIKAAKAGLEPHIAVMFGYPWETDEDAIRTLKLVWWLLRKGYAKTAQASFYCPPDKEVNENHRKYVKQIYNVWKYPDFWFYKLRDIHNVTDLKYFWKCIKAGIQRR